MNVRKWRDSAARALLFGTNACLVFVQLMGMVFALGEASSPVTGETITRSDSVAKLTGEGLLLVAALGILGLIIAAFGALTGKKVFAFIAFLSCVLVLPMAIIYSWNNVRTDIINSSVMAVPRWQWLVDAGAVPIDLAAMLLAWSQIRQKRSRPD